MRQLIHPAEQRFFRNDQNPQVPQHPAVRHEGVDKHDRGRKNQNGDQGDFFARESSQDREGESLGGLDDYVFLNQKRRCEQETGSEERARVEVFVNPIARPAPLTRQSE